MAGSGLTLAAGGAAVLDAELVNAGGALALAEAERVERLDAAAEEFVTELTPANTTLAYAADWRVWRRYCGQVGIPEFTATVGALVGLVAWLDKQGAAPATIDRRLTGATVGLRERGAEVPKLATRKAREALNGIIRRLAEDSERRGRGQAEPADVRTLRTACAHLDQVLADNPPGSKAWLTAIRDRALLLVGFGIAARRSELANLDLDDVAETGEGLVVTVRFGKAGGRAFRGVDRHGNLTAGISPAGVGHILGRLERDAGITIHLTGHSLRAGLATEARRAGHDVKTISDQTGHAPNSKALYAYLRRVDQWADNAVKGIGL